MDLITKSTRIADLSIEHTDAYSWISPTRIFCLRSLRGTGWFWNKPPFVAITQGYHTHDAEVFDLTTRAWHPSSAFNNRSRNQLLATPMHMCYVGTDGKENAPSDIHYIPPRVEISPNGKWALWQYRGKDWIVASLDGHTKRSWMGCGGYGHTGLWLRDGRWIQKISESLDWQWVVQKLVIRCVEGNSADIVVGAEGIADGLDVGTTEQNGLLLRHMSKGKGDPGYDPLDRQAGIGQEFVEITFENGRAESREFEISVEDGHMVNDVVISYRGNRLAWITHEFNDTEQRDGPVSVYVTDLNGKNRHDVGSILPVQRKPPNSPSGIQDDYPRELQWIPGDSNLSFVFDRGIWSVPVS